MVYVMISLVSLLLLGAGIALIAYVVGTNSDKIVDALLGRPQAQHTATRPAARMRARVRTLANRPPPLRAAA